MTIIINQFSAELPRVAETLLPQSGAQIATNCNIVRGSLKAFRDKTAVNLLTLTGKHGTIYRYLEAGGTERWLEWAEDVNVKPGPIASDAHNRVYFTGTDVPRVFDDSQVNSGAGATYPKSSYKLGVSAPTAAPVAALGGGGAGVARDVRHVYTFVRKWASGATDESAPSPAGNIVNALPGQTINLSGITAVPPTERGITHVWIYRLNGSDYQFLAEITIGTTTYADTTLDSALGDIIVSADWLTPPDDGTGLLMLPNGSAVMFSGKQVCFSVPYQVHAFPEAYRYTVPFTIVALGRVGSMVVAATIDRSYYLNATDPAFVGFDEANTAYPCLSKRGLVSTKDGVVYPTHDGLAIVQGGGQTGLLTEAVVSKEEWEPFFPDTILAASYRNRYQAAFHNTGDTTAIPNDGFVINHNTPTSGLVELSGNVHCFYADELSGNLYFVQTNAVDNRNYVYQWDAASARIAYLWKSKLFVLANDTSFGAARILAKFSDSLTQADVDAYNAARAVILAANQALLATDDSGAFNGSAFNEIDLDGDDFQAVPPLLADIVGMTFTLYVDGVVVDTITVDSQEPFRLSSGTRAKSIEVQLQGQIEAQEIRVATSISELANA